MTWLLLLKNRWVQYGLAAVAVLLLFAWARQHYINQGKEQGTVETSQRAADMLNNARDEDRKATAKLLADNDAERKRQADIAQAQQLAFMQLVTQRQQATATVAGMTSGQVEDAIARALGKQPGSATNTEQDRRTIANCLVQLPYCERQVVQLQEQVDTAHKETKTADSSLQALGGYAVRLEQSYTDLYNIKAAPKRSIKCVWMWRCTRPQIKAPNPEELMRTKPR